MLVGADFDRTVLACCESCKAFTGSERTGGPFSVDILATNLVVLSGGSQRVEISGPTTFCTSQESDPSAKRQWSEPEKSIEFCYTTLIIEEAWQ